MNTIKAIAVIGINAGYNHKNSSTMTLADFGSLYQRAADMVMDETGIYIGASIGPIKVEYKTDWGCPVGGEDAIRIEADCNPNYAQNVSSEEYISSWKKAFIRLCQILKEELKQSTMTVSISNIQLEYLR